MVLVLMVMGCTNLPQPAAKNAHLHWLWTPLGHNSALCAAVAGCRELLPTPATTESGKQSNKLDGSTQFNQKPQNPTESNSHQLQARGTQDFCVCFPFGFLSQTGFAWLQFHFCLHFSQMRREQDVMFTSENKNEIIHTSFEPFCH